MRNLSDAGSKCGENNMPRKLCDSHYVNYEGMIFCGESTNIAHELHTCRHCENFVLLTYTFSTTAFLVIVTLSCHFQLSLPYG